MTPAFETAWTSLSSRRPVALARIVTPTLTLYAATDSILVGGQFYEPLLGSGTISNTCQFMGTGLQLATADFSLLDRPRSGGGTTLDLFAVNQFVGASVTIWLWERSLSDFATDALQRFVGIIQTYSIRTGVVTLSCVQSRAFNQSITPLTITRDKYPQAPDASVGLPLPTYYGKVQAPSMRDPFLNGQDVCQRARELVAGGRRAGKGILVDTGRGTGQNARVVVAGHPCYQIGNYVAAPTSTVTGCTITTPANSPSTVVLGSATTLSVGMFVACTTTPANVPPLTVITAVTDTTHITLSDACVAGAAQTLTFSPVAGSFAGGGVFLNTTDGKLATLEIAAANFFNNSTDGAGFFVTDATSIARYPLFPSKVIGTGTSATAPSDPSYAPPENANVLSDGDTEYSSVRVGTYYNGAAVANSSIAATFPTPGASGTLTKLTLYIAMRFDAAPGVSNAKWKLNLASGTQYATGSIFDGAPVASYANGTVDPHIRAWDIVITGSVPATLDALGGNILTINATTPSPNCVFDVFFVGIAASYVPDQSIVRTDTNLTVTPVPMPMPNPFPSGTAQSIVNTYQQKLIATATYEFLGDFFAHVSGWADDGAGKFTGSAGTLVERIPDVVRHMLSTYGLVPDANIVTGSAFGSFTDARAMFKTWMNTDMVLGFSFAQTMQLSQLLSWVMTAGACDVWCSSFDGFWRILPWKTAPTITYARPLVRLDVLDPERGVELTMTPDSDVISSVVVNYGKEASSDATTSIVSASATSSAAGHLYHSLRDGMMTVTHGVNDAIDLVARGVNSLPPVVAYIPTGDYDSSAIVSGLTTLFTAKTSFTVVAGVNDRVDYEATAGGSVSFTTVAAGTYTRAAWVTALSGMMNTILPATGAACSDTAAGLMFSRNSGASFRFRWDLNPTINARALFGFSEPLAVQAVALYGLAGWYLGGFNPATSWTVTLDSEYRLHLTSGGGSLFWLLWRTGLNGLLGTKRSASGVLGFDWQNDDRGISPVAAGMSSGGAEHVGVAPRFIVERALAGSDAIYGPKVPVQIDGRCISDTRTAVELRNRLVGTMNRSRGTASFATETCPDMERGDVFAFDVDMDALRSYGVAGTDGSWAGKTFRVTEEHGHFGDAWHSEIVAIDLTQ